MYVPTHIMSLFVFFRKRVRKLAGMYNTHTYVYICISIRHVRDVYTRHTCVGSHTEREIFSSVTLIVSYSIHGATSFCLTHFLCFTFSLFLLLRGKYIGIRAYGIIIRGEAVHGGLH